MFKINKSKIAAIICMMMMLASSIANAEVLTFTKAHRVIALASRLTFIDWREVYTGTTWFSDVWYPYHFESDSLEEANQYAEQNGIVLYQEEF